MSGQIVLKRSLLERLVRYCHYMQDKKATENLATISSVQIAEYADLDESQVRKDLAAIGVKGTPRVGYKTAEVIAAIRDRLGFDDPYSAVLIGAGRLGGAIVSYPGFLKYGLRIVGLFDDDPRKTGSLLAGLVVQPVDRIGEVIRREEIELAILAVPPEAAQVLAQRLVELGIRSIWNFAPTWLSVPDHVHVRHEHLSVGLAELAYHLNTQR